MVMKVGILSSQRGYHVLALEEALHAKGCEPVFFPWSRLTGSIGGRPALHVRGEGVEDCCCVLVRTIPSGSLEQIIFRMDALHRLENLDVRVVNSPASIERTVDKYYTSFLLEDAGILTPKTVVAEDFETALAACREMGDVILKPLFGSEGKGIVRLSDEETAYRVLRAWELNRFIFYVQEYVPHFQKDIRAFVVGDKVVAAMIRKGTTWKTNISQGATAEPITLDGETESLAIQAAHVAGLDYAGVDLLPAENGKMYVLEVNSVPGWRGLQKITARNIAGSIVEHALDMLLK
jgi:RimK family alpha-L-glutamate ligase